MTAGQQRSCGVLLQWAAEQARQGPQQVAQVAEAVAQRLTAAGGKVDYVEVCMPVSRARCDRP